MRIVVDPNKILRYLLLDVDKGRFFRRFGYAEGNWEQLQADLVSLATSNTRRLRQKTVYGEEYEIAGDIIAPDGRAIFIKSGWMIDDGDPDTIRFVTAYPG